MKIFNICLKFISLLFVVNISCAQKFEKPKKSNKVMHTDKKNIRAENIVNNLSTIIINEKGLYCHKIDDECYVLDGKTTIYSEYQTTGTDNPAFIPYLYAEGEFLEGKYQGIWKFYDKNKKLIKKEKWDNGNLIYRKKYNETE